MFILTKIYNIELQKVFPLKLAMAQVHHYLIEIHAVFEWDRNAPERR